MLCPACRGVAPAPRVALLPLHHGGVSLCAWRSESFTLCCLFEVYEDARRPPPPNFNWLLMKLNVVNELDKGPKLQVQFSIDHTHTQGTKCTLL